MTRAKEIYNLYSILLLFEELGKPETEVNLDNYLKYLERLHFTYEAINQVEISAILQGLHNGRDRLSHDTVRSIVFHMIDLIKKGEGLSA